MKIFIFLIVAGEYSVSFKISRFLPFMSSYGILPAEMVLKSSPFERNWNLLGFFPPSLDAKYQKQQV